MNILGKLALCAGVSASTRDDIPTDIADLLDQYFDVPYNTSVEDCDTTELVQFENGNTNGSQYLNEKDCCFYWRAWGPCENPSVSQSNITCRQFDRAGLVESN